jgi:hypothetical protein
MEITRYVFRGSRSQVGSSKRRMTETQGHRFVICCNLEVTDLFEILRFSEFSGCMLIIFFSPKDGSRLSSEMSVKSY